MPVKSAHVLAAALAALPLALSPAAFAQTSPSAFTSATRYNANQQVVGTIAPDPDGAGPLHHAATRNSYDAAGRLIKAEKGELATWQSEAVAPASWSGFTVATVVDIVYDALDRKVKESVSGWDSATSALVVTQVTQFSYDSLGRLKCVAIRMNPAVFTGLPASACTLGTTGSNGPDRITANVYDAAGQLLKVQQAYGVTLDNGFPVTLQQDHVTYTYSPNGRTSSVTDANGNKASLTYDGHDRLAQWNLPDKVTAGTVSATDYEAYTYDANGNRLTLRRRDGTTISFRYDALNRMVQKRVPDAASGAAATTTTDCQAGTSLAGASDTNDVCYNFDLRGLQTDARFGTLTGAGIAYSYDGFGRLRTSTNSMGGTSRTLTYGWDAGGNRTSVTHPDGNATTQDKTFTYEYDGLNRLTTVKENGSTTIASLTYNERGGRKSITRGAVTTDYSYDPISRLSAMSDDLVSSPVDYDLSTGFQYNPANQIVRRTQNNDAYAFTGLVNVGRVYAKNGLNQYTSAGPASFTYDANGNLISDGGTAYSYDRENRLISASGVVNAQIKYDPLGRIFEVGVKQFLYDGDELVAEYASATGALSKRYVHGTAVDDPLIWYGGAGVSSASRMSMQSDYQGSIVSVADANGNKLTINSYDEYGIPAPANAGRFQYTGQSWLPELGLYYYKARFYSPTLGRFLQTDPIGYDDQVNLYAYVGDDPVNASDPTGTSKFDDIFPDSPRPGGCVDWCWDKQDKPGGDKAGEKKGDRKFSYITVYVWVPTENAPSGYWGHVMTTVENTKEVLTNAWEGDGRKVKTADFDSTLKQMESFGKENYKLSTFVVRFDPKLSGEIRQTALAEGRKFWTGTAKLQGSGWTNCTEAAKRVLRVAGVVVREAWIQNTPRMMRDDLRTLSRRR